MSHNDTNRLLIMACSQRKNPAHGLLPAIERYDGPLYFVLRKYLRDPGCHPPKLLILSAMFGLIPADLRIPDYDCRLTASRADELRPGLGEAVKQVGTRFTDVLICAGSDYKRLILEVKQELGIEGDWKPVPGGQGAKLGCLYRWLRDDLARKAKKGTDNGSSRQWSDSKRIQANSGPSEQAARRRH